MGVRTRHREIDKSNFEHVECEVHLGHEPHVPDGDAQKAGEYRGLMVSSEVQAITRYLEVISL